MDKVETYLLDQTSVRDYITFEQFKTGFPNVNQRLLRAFYQQLIAKDDERHDSIQENLREFNTVMEDALHQTASVSSANGASSSADPVALDKLASKLAQKLDERAIALDLETQQQKHRTDKTVDALNDLRYGTSTEKSIESTKKEIDSLLNSLP